VYEGNDITGGEDELSRSPKFRKATTGKSVVWTHALTEAELVSLNAVEDPAAVPLADWLRLPGIEEVPLWLDIGVDGKGRDGPLLDEAPKLLEPSVGDCECESKLGVEEGSCNAGNDVKLCWTIEPEDGIEALAGVPESIGAEDEWAGEGDDDWLSGKGDEASAVWCVVWGVADGDGKFVELAGGDEALGDGKEFGVFDDKGGKDIGMLDDRDKEMGAFDCDGRGEETGVFDNGGVEEVGVLDKGGKETGIFDDKGEVGVSNDGGGEEVGVFDEGGAEEVGAFDEGGAEEVGAFDEGGAEEVGAFDEGGAEEVGAFDERGGKEMGLFDERDGAGVPDEDANEVGVWGCEDGTEVGGTSVDAEGTIHWPRRSTPKGHVAVGGEEVEGDEGGWDDWGLLMAGEGVGVELEVGGEEDGLLVDGGEDELLAGGEEEVAGSLVCGGAEEDGLLDDSTENGLVDRGGDEVPPGSGRKMAPGQSGKVMEEWAGHLPVGGSRILPTPLNNGLGLIWRWMCWLWGGRGRRIWWTASRPWAAWGRKNKREKRKARKETLYSRVILYTGRIKGVWEHEECRKGKGERQLSQSSQAMGAKESEKRPAHSH
jgi:hypothetical protein